MLKCVRLIPNIELLNKENKTYADFLFLRIK
jgi:hypothetical protein